MFCSVENTDAPPKPDLRPSQADDPVTRIRRNQRLGTILLKNKFQNAYFQNLKFVQY